MRSWGVVPVANAVVANPTCQNRPAFGTPLTSRPGAPTMTVSVVASSSAGSPGTRTNDDPNLSPEVRGAGAVGRRPSDPRNPPAQRRGRCRSPRRRPCGGVVLTGHPDRDRRGLTAPAADEVGDRGAEPVPPLRRVRHTPGVLGEDLPGRRIARLRADLPVPSGQDRARVLATVGVPAGHPTTKAPPWYTEAPTRSPARGLPGNPIPIDSNSLEAIRPEVKVSEATAPASFLRPMSSNGIPTVSRLPRRKRSPSRTGPWPQHGPTSPRNPGPGPSRSWVPAAPVGRRGPRP